MLTSLVHLKDTPNIGDKVCAPYHYFDFPNSQEIDIRQTKETIKSEIAIFGGGAIEPYVNGEKSILDYYDAKHKVTWGIGSSRSGLKKNPPFNPTAFALVGLREWGREGGKYVPCVSCMSSLFDDYKDAKVVREVGLYAHAVKQGDVLDHFPGIPSVDNRVKFEEAIEFIATSDIVITNSFHGTYWSLLLGKKVLCVPFSSKFYGFKCPPNYTTFANWQVDIHKKLISYDEYLEDSRKINKDFYQEVLSLYK